MTRNLLFSLFITIAVSGCGSTAPPSHAFDPVHASWSAVLKAARGQTVHLAMWQGDPSINAYMRDYVTPKLQHRYGITLDIQPGQGNQIVNRAMTEAEAKRARGSMDMAWINGATFYQLRQIHALYGPFTQALPNNRYIDWNNPFIARDFQQPVNGKECPWGNVQLLLITDSKRVPHPPRTPQALATWIHAHPGRFTFGTGFTGMSFLKSLMYAFASSPQELKGPYNPEVYRRLRDKVFAWVRSVRADLWHHGRTFASGTAQLNHLFADGEVDFSMSFNDVEVDNRVDSGLFPATAQAFVLHTGTLENSHYMGIFANAPHKAASMVVANFLISPAAQYRKALPSVWGDGTVLTISRLPAPWTSRFRHLPGRTHAPPRAKIQRYARPEPTPKVMTHLSADFRKTFLRG